VKTPEAMAVNLLGLFEAERIRIPPKATLRASLQLPERSGKASGILYTPRTGGGHADDFWSMALAVWSARSYETPFAWPHSRRVLAFARLRYSCDIGIHSQNASFDGRTQAREFAVHPTAPQQRGLACW
jgi:hypothetical protein